MLRVLHGFRLARAAGFPITCCPGIGHLVFSGCSGGFSLGDLLPSSSPQRTGAASTSIGTGQVKVGSHPAALGKRKRSGGRTVHAQCSRDGARRVQQSRYPAAGEGRRQAAPRALSKRRSRCSMRAQRSSSGRCLRSRSDLSARSRAPRNVPVIAFSTDANVAARGVYLLSFLPGIRCRSHHQLCRRPGPAVIRRACSR